MGRHRKIAALDLVLALGAGFHGLQAALDREIDRLIITGLEMQVLVVLDAAPVPAVQRLGADQVEGSCHR